MFTLAAGAGLSLLALVAVGVVVARTAHGEAASQASTATGAEFKDGKFQNIIPGEDPMARGNMLKTMREFLFNKDAVRVPTEPLPVQARGAADFERLVDQGLSVTWLGHSTLLIEIDGKRVLTDPIWSKRASPVGFTGPARFFEPPLAMDDLPPIDAVIISHDHYDHLDEETIKALAERVPHFVVPLKVGGYLQDWGVPASKITELDWWQETDLGELRLVCTPARHFSGRGLFDRDQTLWASWALMGPKHRAYFSGDGGMSPSFAEIGERLGPFDVTMMEVGAYHPNWADIHAGPEQAVQAHRDLRGGIMLPIHWATFNLAMHGWTEPGERLLVAAEKQGIDLALPRPGESVQAGTAPTPKRWWPELPWQTEDELPVISPGLESAEPSSARKPVAQLNETAGVGF